MNDHLFLLGFIAGAVSMLLFVLMIWIAQHLIKMFGRQCRVKVDDPKHPGQTKPCGRFTKRHTIFVFTPGETVTWRDSKGRIRTHIFGMTRVVYAECKVHGHHFVKIDKDAMDIVNAYKIKRRHPEQLKPEPQTVFSAERSMPQLLGQDKAFNAEREPEGISLQSLYDFIQQCFTGLGERLDDLMEEDPEEKK